MSDTQNQPETALSRRAFLTAGAAAALSACSSPNKTETTYDNSISQDREYFTSMISKDPSWETLNKFDGWRYKGFVEEVILQKKPVKLEKPTAEQLRNIIRTDSAVHLFDLIAKGYGENALCATDDKGGILHTVEMARMLGTIEKLVSAPQLKELANSLNKDGLSPLQLLLKNKLPIDDTLIAIKYDDSRYYSRATLDLRSATDTVEDLLSMGADLDSKGSKHASPKTIISRMLDKIEADFQSVHSRRLIYQQKGRLSTGCSAEAIASVESCIITFPASGKEAGSDKDGNVETYENLSALQTNIYNYAVEFNRLAKICGIDITKRLEAMEKKVTKIPEVMTR